MLQIEPKRGIHLLLLFWDRYGANCTMGGKKLSILNTFRSFGWDLTLAGPDSTVSPCPFAAKRGAGTVELDCTVSEVADVTVFDGISILPGPAFEGLVGPHNALMLVKTAFEKGLIVSAWCRGVRVLAAADVVRDKRIVCHSDDRAFIEAAGGIFVGHDHLPVIDGTLVTGARSDHYRSENATAIRKAVTEHRSVRSSDCPRVDP